MHLLAPDGHLEVVTAVRRPKRAVSLKLVEHPNIHAPSGDYRDRGNRTCSDYSAGISIKPAMLAVALQRSQHFEDASWSVPTFGHSD